MASSAETPGAPAKNETDSGEGKEEAKKTPGPPGDKPEKPGTPGDKPDQKVTPPPANATSPAGGRSKNNTTPATSPPPPPPASPPPAASPPPSSPPPAASPPPASPPPPPSPPPASGSGSRSQPAASPPPSQQQSSPPPDGGGASPDQSTKSPPAPTGQASPPPGSPPGAGGQSTPSANGATESGAGNWAPPSQPRAQPPPSTSDSETPSTPNEKSSSGLTPPSDSKSSNSKSSPEGSSSSSPSKKSPPSSSGSSSVSDSSSASSSNDEEAIIGATVAGVVLVALVAIFFVARGRRKRRDTYYMPPPKFFNEKPHVDPYYYSQNYQMGNSGPVDPYFGSQTQQMHSYGSQRGGGGYHGGGPDSGVLGGSKSFFTYDEVIEITNGFAAENIIGEGGFGCVYKGFLPDGKVVAVKELKAGSGQGEREFRAEVEIISRVHHRHLVSLVGYCISDKNRLLIYEFVPNDNLEHHLHGQPVLEWTKRVKIALGAAKGLAYLHEDCHPKIIHRDIKSANILLDDEFEAQVADFGLAKLNDSTQTHVSTRVMGTFGYLAPEYASSGKLTDRSDVFSFGVVLLELITGRKPVDPTQPLGDESLVEWARPVLIRAIETGKLSEIVDPRLEMNYVESEMFRMIEAAAACVRHSAPKRPRMVQVVRALDTEGEMSDLSNGVKYGQSTIYDSGQYNQDITMFRKMALGLGDSCDMSGDYASKDASRMSQGTASECTSGELETRAINQHPSKKRYFDGQGLYDHRL